MPLTPEEAALHLKEAESAISRSAHAYRYATSSPHLILWGVIWVIGYLATAVLPAYGHMVWIALIAFGCIGSMYLGRHCAVRNRVETAPKKSGWLAFGRGLTLVVSIFAFMCAVYAIFGPPNGMQMAAFPALLVGQIYICIGLFGLGTRIAITGAAIFVLTLVGYFLLAPYFLPWMAFVGGGALIVSGFWLRKA